MPTVSSGLSENLRFTEDPDTGRITYIERYEVTDLTPGTPAALFAQALALVPARGTAGPIVGTVVVQRIPEAWGATDCYIDVVYQTPAIGGIGDPPQITIQTSLQQSESDFDAANLALPFGSRTPITVKYDQSSNGAPGPSPLSQSVRVPVLQPRSVVTFTRTINYNPAAESWVYVGKKNADVFLGEAIGTFLCLEMTAEAVTSSRWRQQISFAYDPIEKFQQVARWVNPTTGVAPELTAAQVNGQNGIKLIDVQGSVNFAPLGLSIP